MKKSRIQAQSFERSSCSPACFSRSCRRFQYNGLKERNRLMSPITLEVPDDLAEQLRSLPEQVPRILELGLRQIRAESQGGYTGASEVLEFLAGLPTPEEILALRPSPTLQARIGDLLEKRRHGDLAPADAQEWERFQYLEHLVRVAKANAQLKL